MRVYFIVCFLISFSDMYYLVHNMVLKLMVNHLPKYKPINPHDSLELQ